MTTITVQELKELMDSGENVHLLDVREPAEFAEANLGGLLLPLGHVANAQIDDIEEWRTERVIIHCRSGMRSMQACMILEQMGFTNTVNVSGGIIAWHEAFGA
jgi:rhodanese-related sulfurtransferase